MRAERFGFYLVFIPTVLGGMAFFVITDIVRRQIRRRKGTQAGEGGSEGAKSK
jgi:hypothetical protein